jgi:mannose-6-phosphate isomerase
VNIYPLKFEPIYKKRIWGGQKLREVFHRELPQGEKIGESWDLVDLPDDKSIVANGELAGQTLYELLKKFPQEIIGKSFYKKPFPILIKFLDAQDILSVQVHPDQQSCIRLGQGKPKTEFWYVISAIPGAFIYKGLKNGVDKKKFSEAIKQGGVADLLVKIPVEAGQCYYLPAGTVHSIGPGLLIAEVQTPSDTTYRVFDFDRLDEYGRARELHLHQALESIHFNSAADQLPVSTNGRLVKSKFFVIDKYSRKAGDEQVVSQGQMKILIFIKGRGIILCQSGVSVEFNAGDCLLMPANVNASIRFAEAADYLAVGV